MHRTLRVDSGPFTLEASIVDQSESTLIMQYVFKNDSPQNAYLFNKLYKGWEEQGFYSTGRDIVYVEMDATQAVVSKKIIPVPPDMEVEKPVIPCVTLVRAGEKFEETISINLPLKTWTPYLRSRGAAAREFVAALPLWFELGFFTTTKEGDALAKTVRTADGPALYFYPFSASRQRILRVGPLLDAPVLIQE
ncbi:MAG: hypothetical protein LAP13_27140 [Acidobacteriia bacterium]|nr:hypothetical protein [Terriglobia bacterium]